MRRECWGHSPGFAISESSPTPSAKLEFRDTLKAMNQYIRQDQYKKGFVNIIIIVGILILVGTVGYFIDKTLAPKPIPPATKSECKSDSDCPSAQYRCEATQGIGTACQDDDPSCVSTSAIIEGICKLKEGNGCREDSDCVAGLLCHANACTSPIGRQCSGPSDISCPTDYKCVQGCGWPVPHPDEPPPSYYCQLKGYTRNCPICLAGNTLIETPSGSVSVKDLSIGMSIWTTDKAGHRVPGVVQKTSRVPVPPSHHMVHLILNDGRDLFVSPGHPTTDGRTVGDLKTGDVYDRTFVGSAIRFSYEQDATYDILPSGETGFYWANGILLGSTLFGK